MRRGLESSSLRRKKSQTNQHKRWAKIRTIFLMVLLGLCLVGGGMAWVSGLAQYGIERIKTNGILLSQQLGFKVNDILVDGRFKLPKEVLMKDIGVAWGDPLISFDPWSALEKLEKNPWVRSCLVERRWPEIIYIQLSERVPIARWQHDHRVDLIDQDGEVIHLSLNQTLSPVGKSLTLDDSFQDLPLFIGANVASVAPGFLKKMDSYPYLKRRIVAYSYVGNRRWTVYIDQQIEVKLPEDNLDEALRKLHDLHVKGILTSQNLQSVDLRFLPQIVVRPAIKESPTGVQEREPKETEKIHSQEKFKDI